eukprot:PhM_4_TR17049/c0_g1_i2/m.8524/K00939/adk, AK; adenylate kinase
MTTKPMKDKKAVVFPSDTLLGKHLTNTLIEQGATITAISSGINTSVPLSKAHCVTNLNRTDLPNVKKALLEADTIVYQATGGVQDATNALKLLSSTHYENSKTFILVSTAMTWAETRPVAGEDAAEADDGEPKELEPLTEDQFNKRVPHAKYLVWKEVEKLCRNVNNPKLQTYVVFSGLMYGCGEELLHPLFKQAWHLAPEGLPMYGTGEQMLPMIHTLDLVALVTKLMQIFDADQHLEQRYIFGVDEGQCTYNKFVAALNENMGPGSTFPVTEKEMMLFDNVEYYTLNLRLEPGQINTLLDDVWHCKGGIVENMAKVCDEYKRERKIEPLRVNVLGAPSTGKTFFGRELAQWYKLAHFTIADIIADYTHQEVELKEELTLLRERSIKAKREERIAEKKKAKLEELKEQERAAAGDDAPETEPNPDDEDVDEPPDVDVALDADEEKEIIEAVEGEDDEKREAIMAKLEDIKKVLAMKVKPASAETAEAANPKKKPAPPPKGKKVEEKEEPAKAEVSARYTDRALALMVRWKLGRMECRNQGFVLDGFPKTVRQAQLTYQEMEVEVLEDADDIQKDTAEVEEKPLDPALMPEYVIYLKASDSFLLERVQKIQDEAPHNNPDDFQRRLEFHKMHFDTPKNVITWLEAGVPATGDRRVNVTDMNVETCPLVLAPSTASKYSPKAWDQMLLRMTAFVGVAHNFGVTPQEARAEKQRERLLEEEKRAQAAAAAEVTASAQSADRESVQKRITEEEAKLSQMKAYEREMLEKRKGPMKQFLMENVIPVVTKGLIEICERRPDDPVDALAEWLFRHNPTDLQEF